MSRGHPSLEIGLRCRWTEEYTTCQVHYCNALTAFMHLCSEFRQNKFERHDLTPRLGIRVVWGGGLRTTLTPKKVTLPGGGDQIVPIYTFLESHIGFETIWSLHPGILRGHVLARKTTNC